MRNYYINTRFFCGVSVVFILVLCALPTKANQRLTSFARSIFADRSRVLAADGKISRQAFEEMGKGKSSTLVILMSDQADVSQAYNISNSDERGWFVYRTLLEHAKTTQGSILSELKRRNVSHRSFWVANMIVADLDPGMAVEIAGRSDVALIDSNRPSRWIEESQDPISNENSSREGPESIEWGVSNVNAPDVWSRGFNGTGIVIGGLDTGIRWTHSAIKSKYRGWNGTTADHNYNWFDSVHTGGGSCGPNSAEPCDDHGHGSHTVGTMVGDDANGNQIGVAPGAKWIGCRNMNVGDGSPATYSECFQFMIAPTDLAGNNPNPTLRPHILNNSWGCTTSEGCTTRAELETIVNNVQASGIFVQASAGNSGNSGCSSVSQALAIYDASFSAGSIDVNNALVGSSSRGPSTYYTPNLLKPNVTAPGSNVRSISGTSDTAYTPMSGTSMASPHVAGVVALLWSARPHLVRNIAATKELLQSTANPSVLSSTQTCGGIPSTQIPNNSFGYGRVDALAALNASIAEAATVSGRVLSPEGTAIRNAIVFLSDSTGVRRTATTSSFGIFTFEGIRLNESYTLTVSSKRYRFAPRTINVTTAAFAAGDVIGLQ